MTDDSALTTAQLAILDVCALPGTPRNLDTSRRMAEAALSSVRHQEIRRALVAFVEAYVGTQIGDPFIEAAYDRAIMALTEDPT